MKKIILLLFIVTFPTESKSQCWQSISAGDNHTLAIKVDGLLWAWGSNNFGNLGVSGAYINVPTQVENQNEWQAVFAGYYHSMAKKIDGTLWGWGGNYYGQIGIGANGVEYPIIAFSSNIIGDFWQSIASGNEFTLALKSDGSLWSWGHNSNGQLGDGTFVNKDMPHQIDTNSYLSVATGYDYGIAIKSDGTLWKWGGIPNQVGLDSDWEIITSKYALKADGTLWDISLGSVQVGSDNDWTNVSCKKGHALALKSNGSLWAWGENSYGQLGDGSTNYKITPIQIGIDTDWKTISAGSNFSMALKEDNTLFAWGANHFGQLGDETYINKNTPTLINCATLNVKEVNQTNSFVIYPNPTQDIINIYNKENIPVENFSIVDSTGKLLFEQSGSTKINIQQLEAGIYFLRIHSESKVSVVKIIKN